MAIGYKWGKQMWESVVRSLLFVFGMLLCVAGSGLAFAYYESSAGNLGSQQRVEKPAHSERVVSKSAEPKALTSKYPRRTDVPDSVLVVMLALIGIVVIARRDVSVKGSESATPKGSNQEREVV